MTKRLGFGGGYNDYDEEDHQLEPDQDFPDDLGYADDAAAGGLQEQDRVEHQLNHANDDGRQTNFDDRFDEWRKRVSARRKGRFVPPDTRMYRGPVFVRVKDL